MVVLVIVGATVVAHLMVEAAPTERGPAPYVRWMLISNLIQLVLWVGIVLGLGWRRGAGLVVGRWSLWGVVPVVALLGVSLLEAGQATGSVFAPALQVAIAVKILIGALEEEIAFRGFLFHGLTTRLGGTAAVLLGSSLFAVYHIPKLTADEVVGSSMLAALVFYFGGGVFLCRVRAATGSIWLPTAVHTLWNVVGSEIAIWAFPEGSYPGGLGSLRLAIVGTGLFLAYGLLIRASVARGARRLVSSGPQASHVQGTAAPHWRSLSLDLSRPPSREVVDRFDEDARRTLVLAREEARTEGMKSIGTEHLLLALTHEGGSVAAAAFEEWGIALGTRTRLDELLAAGSLDARPPRLDQRARMVVQLARLEADAWKDPRIGSEHLLLGLTAVRQGGAYRVLRRRGLDPARLRRTTLQLMEERSWSSAGDASIDTVATGSSEVSAGGGSHEPHR